MTALILLFAAAVLNVGVGYALAVSLGVGPQRLHDAWLALGLTRPSHSSTADRQDFLLPSAVLPEIPETALAGSTPGRVPEPIAEYGGGAT